MVPTVSDSNDRSRIVSSLPISSLPLQPSARLTAVSSSSPPLLTSTLTASMPVPSLSPMGVELGVTDPELLTTSFSIFMLGVGVNLFFPSSVADRAPGDRARAYLFFLLLVSSHRLALSSSLHFLRSTDGNRCTPRRW